VGGGECDGGGRAVGKYGCAHGATSGRDYGVQEKDQSLTHRITAEDTSLDCKARD